MAISMGPCSVRGKWSVAVGVALTVAAGLAPAQPAAKPPPAASDQPAARAVSRSECLPADQLPPELRAKSEELLLQLLDREGLYTLVGGLKPVTGPDYGPVG